MAKRTALIAAEYRERIEYVASRAPIGARTLVDLLLVWGHPKIAKGTARAVLEELGLSWARSARYAARAEALPLAREAQELHEGRPASPMVSASPDADGGLTYDSHGTDVRTLEQLVEVCEIDLDAFLITSVEYNKWAVGATGPDGRLVTTPLFQVKAKTMPRPMARLERAPPRFLPPPEASPEPAAVPCMLLIPDTQCGYVWNDNHTVLTPLHDRRAMDVYLQVADLLQPERIVLLGDMLDLAAWSMSYTAGPGALETTQPAINVLHWFLSELRRLCPHARIDIIPGNHEHRIVRRTRKHMAEASRLTQACGGRPVLSLEHLLRLDELGIACAAPYGEPGADLWIWGDLYSHGYKARPGGGATAAATLKASTRSSAYGHVHKVEVAWRTLHEEEGARSIWAMSPGMGCLPDGTVPGVTHRPDWLQGFATVELDPTSGKTYPTPYPILDGVAVLRGRRIEGRDRAEEIAAAIGYPQVAG